MKFKQLANWRIIALSAGIAVFAQCSSTKKSTAGTGSSEIIFFDDFSGNALDRFRPFNMPVL